ncbi:MAG: peptidoglycan-binding [Geobacteraceae bacterium]|nr:MAG: peptidoglycan-binding [Geobacteraceae bacterium]
MKRHASIIAGCLAVACSFPPQITAGEYYLYAPEPAESGKPPADPAEGILVKDITIRQGDTLKSISGKYSGRRSFFPQILLFNRIKNPDLIHTGNTLRVPVSRATSDETAAPGKRKRRAGKPQVRAHVKKTAAPAAKRSATAASHLYENAVKSYRTGAYQKALEGFDRFLATYPDSPLAPDATLFRADCYLKLSGE